MEEKLYKNKQWLQEEYVNRGSSLEDIAKICNVDRTTIQYWLKKSKIPRRSFRDSHTSVGVSTFCNKKTLSKLYAKMSTVSMASMIGVSAATISNWLRLHHIKTRPRSTHLKGKKLSSNTKEKMRISAKKGPNNHNWKGGITKLNKQIRTCYKNIEWRQLVFSRDNFICQNCGKHKTSLQADHIKPFAKIIQENCISTLDQALECQALWDLKNGRTLCISCHRKTDTWGNKQI